MIGSVNDEILSKEELAVMLIDVIKERYSGSIKDRYEVDEIEDSYKLLEDIAIKRNCIKKGAAPDTLKAADIILDEFRGGVIGRFSLDTLE
jgi:ribosome biogenesis GTPase A